MKLNRGMRLDRIRGLTVWCVLSILSLLVNFTTDWRNAHLVDFSSEASRVSWALQHHHGFSDPYLSGPSGPTAQMAPIYPFLHATTCLMFGTGAVGWAAILALTALAWSLQWTFAYDFLRYYGHPRAGLGAALLGVTIPLPGRLLKWEAVFTACALAAGSCLMARLVAKPDPKTAGLLGGVAATSLLLTPSTVVVFFAWGVVLLWRRPFKSTLSISAVALACAMLPVGLWTARNYRTFGHLFFMRDDAGITFASSNTDCSQALLIDNITSGCIATVHPSANASILARLRTEGEYQFSASQLGTTVAWVDSHPMRFIILTLERSAYFWFPLERSGKLVFINGLAMSLVTVLSLLSVLWRRSPGFAILAAGLTCYPVVYYFIQAEQRYRYPVYWMSIALAAVGIELTLHRLREHRSRMP